MITSAPSQRRSRRHCEQKQAKLAWDKKKFKRQKQRNNLPWLFVAVGGIFLVIAALFLPNRDEGGTPFIAVDQQKIDYGDVKLGVNKSSTIRVTNTGDGTLRFKEELYIEILEGC